jgi:FAD/FMN-containing dehydrogenase
LSGLIDELRTVVEPAHVLTDPDLVGPYVTDWTGRWAGYARAVVRPSTVDQVAAIVRACAKAGAGIVPQGGNTGLVGASVPRGGEVVLSLRRLAEVGPVDLAAAHVRAGAGVTLAQLQAVASDANLRFAVDLSARDSATVGGMIATNAGGMHVLRYGSMRAQVLGVEAVLADGSVLRRMDGLVKDNTGYDLIGLLCGSEGTLGIVTAAQLKLVAAPRFRVTSLVAVAGTASAVSLLARLRSLAPLEAVEIVFADGVDLVCRHAGLPPPFSQPYPCLLVVECAGSTDPTGEMADVIGEGPDVLAVAVASERAGRDKLWSWRERHTETVNALGIPHKLDVTVPIAELAGFERDVRATVSDVAPGSKTILWGHLGDGNLHVNVIGPDPDDDRVDEAVLRLVAARGGSISAEHGIGIAKRNWIGLTRSPADMAAMRAVKAALDPNGILNPGVLFDEGAGRAGSENEGSG